MNDQHSDAFVFFGATGDLAYKKIFPSLQAMVKRGALNVPVIGVAKSGWGLEQLQARARESVEKHGGLDQAAFVSHAGAFGLDHGGSQDESAGEGDRSTVEGMPFELSDGKFAAGAKRQAAAGG